MKRYVLPLWIGLMVVLFVYAGLGSNSDQLTTSFDSSGGKPWAAIGGGILLYWLPTVIAFVRATSTATFVAVVNLLTGWTGLGWLVALLFSFLGKRQD